MKTLFTCDEVFELLTAAPIRTDSEEAEAIREHNKTCDSCRQLADALRPACHLIHEAMPRDSQTGLPAFEVDDSIVTEVMSQLEGLPSHKLDQNKKFSPTMTFVVGLAAMLTIMLLWRSLPAESSRVASASVSLSEMNLPTTCLHVQSKTTDIDITKTVCCTECHSSKDQTQSIGDMSLLIAACTNCH